MKRSILVIDDNNDILTAARILLSRKTYEVTTESDPDQIPQQLKQKKFDVILLDMNFTRGVVHGKEGFKWLNVILTIDPSAVVILITAYGDVALAVEAIRKGASDFIEKPWDNQKLLSTISMACDLSREKQKTSLLEIQNSILSESRCDIIGSSPAMKNVYRLMEKVSRTDANVLLTGENGTGKDLVARQIHDKSTRADSVFLGVDMGSITESLFESEMFGYEKGAFTGAEKKRIGRIEAAAGGTLFLDEIGNIPAAQQPKLLRVLETREVVPLGNSGKRQFDIRLICATNGDIKEMVSKNLFRQDLLYRINTVEIHLPALRERQEDIPLLLNHFLDIYKKKYSREDLNFAPPIMDRLISYSWPGNVRELSHLVERAVILSSDSVITIEDFALRGGGETERISDFNLESMEKKIIRAALDAENSNMSRAAAQLGITRATLYRKLDKYGI